jgi:hypothetical protein
MARRSPPRPRAGSLCRHRHRLDGKRACSGVGHAVAARRLSLAGHGCRHDFAWRRLAELTDRFGHRQSGSAKSSVPSSGRSPR